MSDDNELDGIYGRLIQKLDAAGRETMNEMRALGWRPLVLEFPWMSGDIIIAAFDKDDPDDVDIFRVHCGEHGAFFERGSMVSINEHGWVPFAWRPDDVPSRDDKNFPPKLTDYLTAKTAK